MQSLMYFSEMNQAVPGSFASSLMEPSFDCRVPSPSEWSDVCRSPPLLHSPSHFSDYVEKIKEEPYSPQSLFSLRTPPRTFYSVHIPLMSSEGPGEHSINIAELLAENSSLQAQVQQQQAKQTDDKQKVTSSASEAIPLDFLGLIDVKSEFEETHEPFLTLTQSPAPVCSTPATPATVSRPITPSLPTSSGNGGDVLLIALDHYRQSFQEVSKMLNIPSDPSTWTTQNVRAWLQYEASNIEIPLPSLENWQIPGQSLIQLTEAQFRELFPKGGNLFYANLEIWKAAFGRTSLQPPTSFMSTVPQHLFSIQQPVTQIVEPSIASLQVKPWVVSPSHGTFELLSTISTSTSPSTLLPSVSAETLSNMPSTIAITSVQQLQEKATVAKIVSSGQKQPSIVSTTVTTSAYPSSPKPSTSTDTRTGSLLQLKPMDIQQMEASTSYSPDDTLLNIPTLLHTAEPSPQGTSRIQPRTSRAKSESASGEVASTSTTSGRGATHIHLWQFLKELLQKTQEHGACIRWIDRSKGIFKIEDSVKVAKLWGARKNRPAMNYDKLSRSIRQYYKKGIMKKTERSQRLVYQFCHPYCL